MKTKVTISAYAIQIAIAGITIKIDRDEVFDSIDTVQKFVKNVWPEERKEDLESMGFNKACEMISKYKPLAIRALACWTFEKRATSTITINEDGTIDMFSNEQNAKFDVKAFMQVASDFSTLVDEDKKAQREARLADLPVIEIPIGSTRGQIREILESEVLLDDYLESLFHGLDQDAVASDNFYSIIADRLQDQCMIRRVAKKETGFFFLDSSSEPKIPVTPRSIGNRADLDPDQIISFLEAKFNTGYFIGEELSREELEALAREFTSWTWTLNGDGEVTVTEKNHIQTLKDDDPTDQSMDYMADNELVFTKRPTNPQLMKAIENKIGRVLLWSQYSEKMKEQEGMNLDPKLLASTYIIEKACDAYGLKGICKFNEFATETTQGCDKPE